VHSDHVQPHVTRVQDESIFPQVWPNFFDDCGAWAFVVDLSDSMTLSNAAVELWGVMDNPKMASKKCLIILNKKDAPITAHDSDVLLALKLDGLRGKRDVTVVSTRDVLTHHHAKRCHSYPAETRAT